MGLPTLLHIPSKRSLHEQFLFQLAQLDFHVIAVFTDNLKKLISPYHQGITVSVHICEGLGFGVFLLVVWMLL